ncbi:M15 family metallopeptidase [Flavobacterium sp.]|uniref:M15 family metallopeptidase n=1 Tax=Flavobacterium sp. TaxID=239 RepID=UPI0037520D04
MKIKKILIFGLIINFIIPCKSQNIQQNQVIINDTTFVNIKDYSSDFILDMKYATEDNFLETKVYDCQSCFLRLKTIKFLIEANNEFKKKGYKIKLFDCYRPLDVQKKMWAIIPDANYVANPAKGSIHNRGGAVDITLVDENGVELDMGTTFDFFGIESSHDYRNYPKKILKNRRLIKKIMTRNNFESFDSEWWHYNLIGSRKDNLSNFTWQCE